MAKWRAIATDRWRDGDIVSVTREARLLEIGLASLADDHGYLQAKLGTICATIYPRDRDVTDEVVALWLQELLDNHLAKLYDDGIVFLTRFFDEQPTRSDRMRPSKLGPQVKDSQPRQSVADVYNLDPGWRVPTTGCQPPTNCGQVATNVAAQEVRAAQDPVVDDCQPPVDNGCPRLDKTRLDGSLTKLALSKRSDADPEESQTEGQEKPLIVRSVAQLMNDDDLDQVIKFWGARFSKWPIEIPMAQKIIQDAKRLGMSPPLLITRVDPNAKKPLAYYHGMVNCEENLPHLEDGEHRHHSWEAWASRPRKNIKIKGPQLLGDILPGLQIRT